MLILPLLFSISKAICPCPVCPVLAAGLLAPAGAAGAAAAGGAGIAFTAPMIAAMTAYTMLSIPFTVASIDQFRNRNVTFDIPQPDLIYRPGEEIKLFMKTEGLSARFRMESVDVYLLNSTFDRVAKISTLKEFQVLDRVDYKFMGLLPTNGTAHFNWTVPNVPNGRYYLKYVSGWTIWRQQGLFETLSTSFLIKNDDSEIPPSPNATSFTHDTAPEELHFLYEKGWFPLSNIIKSTWRNLKHKIDDIRG